MSELFDPSPTERRRRRWVDWGYRGSVLGLLLLAAGFAWTDNARGVRIEEKVVSLGGRMDRIQAKTDEVASRLRTVEIGHGGGRAHHEE